MVHRTPLMLEQHIHGAFGVDFNKASSDEVLSVSDKLLKIGIGGFFPTLVTDSAENIKRQVEIIKSASLKCPQILGIHLEGIFINPEKKGIHNTRHFLELTKENYQIFEDDFIKIVTLAPELDNGLIDYLKLKGVKVQAGHCVGGNLEYVNGVTHTFNAMSGISHRNKSTALSALVNDNIYSEIIADGIHVSEDALRLFFRSKAKDKIILVSDALPITYSCMSETEFADSKIYYDGTKATSKDGTIAGSTTLLDKIAKYLGVLGFMEPILIENPYRYHSIKPQGEIIWDDEWNIIEVKGGK